MSYREEDGNVVLTMSREDYEGTMAILRIATEDSGADHSFLIDRLNLGNPNYTPYRVDTRNGLPLIRDND